MIPEITDVETVSSIKGFQDGMLSSFKSPFRWSTDTIIELTNRNYRLMRYKVNPEKAVKGKGQVAFYRWDAVLIEVIKVVVE